MRTLKNYRPQHDDDCESLICKYCGASFSDPQRRHLKDCGYFSPKPCTCGLVALLAAPDPLRDLALLQEAVRAVGRHGWWDGDELRVPRREAEALFQIAYGE